MQNLNQSIADLEVARALLHERIKNGLSKKVAKFYDEMIASLQAQILSKKNQWSFDCYIVLKKRILLFKRQPTFQRIGDY